MTDVKAAEVENLDFIKKTYKLLDNEMMNLLKQLIDMDEDEADEQHSDKYWEDLIRGETGYILVAFQDEKPAGIAVVEKKDAREVHLEDLLVLPEFQKHGIGELLVKEARNFAVKKGYEKMSLNVLANNGNARHLYTKQGFQEVKISMLCNL